MARAKIPEDERKDFTLYVDEFQNFATDSFETILSEARKYRLSLVLANQFMTQLKEELREAILGNVGTTITGRIGITDAEILYSFHGLVRQVLGAFVLPPAGMIVALAVLSLACVGLAAVVSAWVSVRIINRTDPSLVLTEGE